jgi:hypothetical protein
MSLRANEVCVAIHLLVIADLSAITLNNFLELAHLGRLKFFDFARIKREDLFELLFTTTSSATPEAKQKYEGIPKGRYNQRGKFFAFFLTCLRKKVAKSL